jgi:glycosyltransferase involved in cell wall biosynthesis
MRPIHLINPFSDCFGGSERHAIEFYHELMQAGYREVTLWTECDPDSRLAAEVPIRRIHPYRGELPHEGVLIFFGAYFPVGEWYRHAKAEKVILIYNTVAPEQLFERMHALSIGRANVTVAYTSGWLKESVGVGGTVIHTPINLEHFNPEFKSSDSDQLYRVGRASRDVIYKHHFRDLELYRRLVEHDCSVSVVGGTCLGKDSHHFYRIDLAPSIPYIQLPQFMRGLDVFFYRTGMVLKEAVGRVVLEAMACGLPVVCDYFGGYVELVEHGVNGMLFESDEEALQILLQLKSDPLLRSKLGLAARLYVEQLMAKRWESIKALLA